METDNTQENLHYLDDQSDTDLDDDEESIASLETDDGEYHLPERILAQIPSKNGFNWYLVKWENCPILRSSWEGLELFSNYPWLLEEWLVELQRQTEGKSKPLDIAAFEKAVLDVELAERRRRILRRLKRKINRVLSIVAA
jgi:hypothetical protein